MTSQNSFEPGDACKHRQCSALLAEMLAGRRISTIDAREELGIGHPAGRVHDLRRQGYAIVTERVSAIDSQGRPHLVASYFLAEFGEAA